MSLRPRGRADRTTTGEGPGPHRTRAFSARPERCQKLTSGGQGDDDRPRRRPGAPARAGRSGAVAGRPPRTRRRRRGAASVVEQHASRARVAGSWSRTRGRDRRALGATVRPSACRRGAEPEAAGVPEVDLGVDVAAQPGHRTRLERHGAATPRARRGTAAPKRGSRSTPGRAVSSVVPVPAASATKPAGDRVGGAERPAQLVRAQGGQVGRERRDRGAGAAAPHDRRRRRQRRVEAGVRACPAPTRRRARRRRRAPRRRRSPRRPGRRPSQASAARTVSRAKASARARRSRRGAGGEPGLGRGRAASPGRRRPSRPGSAVAVTHVRHPRPSRCHAGPAPRERRRIDPRRRTSPRRRRRDTMAQGRAAARSSGSGTCSPSGCCARGCSRSPSATGAGTENLRAEILPDGSQEGDRRLPEPHLLVRPAASRAHFLYDNGRPPRFLGKESVFRVPVGGPDHPRAPARSRSTARRPTPRRRCAPRSPRSSRGECVVVYPEGTITPRPRALADDRQDRRRADRAR